MVCDGHDAVQLCHVAYSLCIVFKRLHISNIKRDADVCTELELPLGALLVLLEMNWTPPAILPVALV